MQDLKLLTDQKSNRLKMTDMKITDRTTRHEIAGHENAGQEENAKTRTHGMLWVEGN